MPTKRTVERRKAVHARCLDAQNRFADELTRIQQKNDGLQVEAAELQRQLEQASKDIVDLQIRRDQDRHVIKDLEDRLRKESSRSHQALDAFENVSNAAISSGRVVHWLVDVIGDADLVLKPREKKS